MSDRIRSISGDGVDDVRADIMALRTALAVRDTQLLELADRVEELDARERSMMTDRHGYDGPFQVSVSNDLATLTIGQGYVYAGAEGKYAWPGSGDTDSWSAVGQSDGVYLLCLQITVDPNSGTFTSVNKPVLIDVDYIDFNLLNNTGYAEAVLCRVKVASNKIVHVRQDQRSDIYVPVSFDKDTGNVAAFYAHWGIGVYVPAAFGSVATVPGAAAVTGNTSDPGGDWPWT